MSVVDSSFVSAVHAWDSFVVQTSRSKLTRHDAHATALQQDLARGECYGVGEVAAKGNHAMRNELELDGASAASQHNACPILHNR
jgi:hypothetical protein